MLLKTKKALVFSLLMPLLVCASATEFSLSKRIMCCALLATLIATPIDERPIEPTFVLPIRVTHPDGSTSVTFLPAKAKDLEPMRHGLINKSIDLPSEKEKGFARLLLMADGAPWHQGTPKICLAAKRCLVNHADMKWHKKCLGKATTTAALGVPITCSTLQAMSCGYPALGISIFCCSYCTLGSLMKCAECQENPENVRTVLNWLSHNSAWQEKLAAQAPRPMHMD